MSAQIELIHRDIDLEVVRTLPVLHTNPGMAALSSRSNRAVIELFLDRVINDPRSLTTTAAPQESIAQAQELIRFGADPSGIVLVYRNAQNRVWQRWMTLAAEMVTSGSELAQILDISGTYMFGFVNSVLADVSAYARREYVQLSLNTVAQKATLINLILAGAQQDTAFASRVLGYRLDGYHVCVVFDPSEVEAPVTELREMAAAAAGRLNTRSVVLEESGQPLTAWFGSDEPVSPATLRGEIRAALGSAVRAFVGVPDQHLAGFIESHRTAQITTALAASGAGAHTVVTYGDLGVAALLGINRTVASEFIRKALGPLADSGPAALTLRHTLRIYFEEGGSAPKAAGRLHTHRNTVLQRLDRISAIMGHDITQQRLDLFLAVDLAERLGIPAPIGAGTSGDSSSGPSHIVSS